MMKKVLMSFVGNRDPYNTPKDKPQTEGGILSICAEITPDIVYLFPSSKETVAPLPGGPVSETESNAHEVEKIYRGIAPESDFRIRPLRVKDVTDFEELSAELDEKISELIAELGGSQNFGSYEFHLNCSSGTQQMTALGYIIANTGRIPRIRRWQSKDPDYATGKTRVREIVVDVIEENNCIEKIRGDLEKLNYYTIRSEGERLSAVACSNRRRNNAKTLAEVFEAYIDLDLMNYEGANKKLKNILSKFTSGRNVHPDALCIIECQRKYLRQILAGGGGIAPIDETPLNLVDLFFNMERSLGRGAFADVLARFRRILEGAAYYVLRTQFRLNPRDIEKSPSQDNFCFLKGWHEFGVYYGHIPFHKAYYALQKLDDHYKDVDSDYDYRKYGEVFMKNEEAIDKLIDIRNNAIVAHGMAQVNEKNAKDCITLAKEMLIALVQDSQEIMGQYPFTPDKIRELVNILVI